MRIFFPIILSAMLGGCAGMTSNPTATVNAIAGPDALQFKTYAIAPAYNATPGLEFDQYAAQVQRVLDARGFVRVNDLPSADAALFLDVKVDSAQTVTSTGVMPTWGQTGYSGSQTQGSYVGNQYYSNTSYTPQYGVTGYMPYTTSATYYPIGFSIGAWVKSGDARGIRQIWNIVVTARSKSGDIRAGFPFLLEAAAPYIAGDSGGMIQVPVHQK